MDSLLRPDGRLIVTVPHPRSDLYLGDPTHVRPITPDVLSLFSRRLNLQWQQDGSANTPLALYTGIDFEIEAVNSVLLSPWRERFAAGEVSEAEVLESAARHFNVIGEMEITLRAVK